MIDRQGWRLKVDTIQKYKNYATYLKIIVIYATYDKLCITYIDYTFRHHGKAYSNINCKF